MSMTELKVSFPAEKLDALRFFMDKKERSIEQELKSYLDKTYEKAVPAQVREYVESRMEPDSAQQGQRQAHAAGARERPARQTCRQRQTASEAPTVPEAPAESEGSAEQENQGMTMSM
ncbi:hypothetical protein OBV_42490 [Oscillibacter valericigenes Sjm18-20]|nr:hypothetical protein OBV_42490 [Oscillibacter valericigenes Sjm18-20]